MSAQIIQFSTASLRHRIKRATANIKGLKKCEPGPYAESPLRRMIREDAERSIAELEAEAQFDEPDSVLYVGPSGEWDQCVSCFCEISPASTVSRDQNGTTHCARCFQGK